MMNVLIVDDEVKVCQLIFHLVDWDALGLKVVGTLHDGQAAREYIAEHKPDIVITDIRMPGCDGLEMIRQVRTTLPETHFIIISGYNNFEYARNAIHYGVEDYLLKPLEGKELTATLERICEKRKAVSQQHSEESKWRDLAERTAVKVKSSLISDMILEPEKIELLSREAINEEYHSHFVEGYYGVLKIQPFIKDHMISEEELELLLSKVEQMLKERLADYTDEMIMKITKPCLWCIVNTRELNWEEIKSQLKKMRLDVLNLKNIFQELKVYVSIGSIDQELTKLHRSMKEADMAMMERLIRPDQYILEYTEEIARPREQLMDQRSRNALTDALDHLDQAGIADELDCLAGQIRGEAGDGYYIYQCYKELVELYMRVVVRFNGEYEAPGYDYFMRLFETFLKQDEVLEGLKAQICRIMEEYGESKKQAEAKPIRMARQYINDHYNETLSLESVSATIGFNPAYFSSLFKKETGKNFMEYIMELRIQNAKQLLVTTEQNLLEIAEAVGYSEMKYFSKVFKRTTGLTPSEYRKLYS